MSDESLQESGFILDGFPRTAAQAEALGEAGVNLDIMILLETPEDVLYERITGRRMDPETGDIYHVTFHPAPTPEIEARLTQRKDDTAEALGTRLQMYNDNLNAILEYYQGKVKVVRINANRNKEHVYADVAHALMNAKNN